MPTKEYAGQIVNVNEEGFLVESGQWTPSIAEAIANELGIDLLTDAHWQVIQFSRDDTTKQGQSPGLRRISKLSGVSMKELYQLFPKGPGKLAARIAGLPKPQACI